MDTMVDSNYDVTCERDDINIYEQLAEKERDLILAAELGKALLEKNDELSRQNEQLLEDIGQLEELHQQKYDLHLLMETKESEYENRIRDLERDNTLLREELEERDEHIHTLDRDRGHVIEELTRQNDRLNDQLQKAAHQEQSLHSQLQSLREQIYLRKSTMHDHVNQLEVLGKEIHNLSDRKTQLERRLAALSRERDNVVEQLETIHEHTRTVERDNKEKQVQLEHQGTEFKRLEEENARLHSKLEKLSLQPHTSICGTCLSEAERARGDSLFDELQSSLCEPDEDEFCESDEDVVVLHDNGANFLNHEAIECDDDVVAMETQSENSPHEKEAVQLRQEIMTAFHTLLDICQNLKSHNAAWTRDHCHGNQERRISKSLQQVIEDLRELIQDVLTAKIEKEAQQNEIKYNVQSLQSELQAANEQLSRLKDDIETKDEHLKRQSEDLSLLSHKIEEKRATDSLQKDEVLQQTINERDEAVNIKTQLADELAKAKRDLDYLTTQLMQAVEQKVALSEQLEKWQEDMHEVIATNVCKQIKSQRGHRRHASDVTIHRRSQSEQSSPETQKKSRFHFW